MRRNKPRPVARRAIASVYVFVTASFVAAAVAIIALAPPPRAPEVELSNLVLDRHDRLLRAYATSEGRWRLPARLKNVDPRFLDALIDYEDKRFRRHFGVDPLALGRAALQLLHNRRIVSGASTITMQVARLLEPRRERGFLRKVREIVRAVELEWVLGKDEILALYLNLAPYGGNLEGVRAASLGYFGKEPQRFTLGETALLVALPQSPELRRPDRSPDASRRARDRVLDRLALDGVFPADEVEAAKREPVPQLRNPMPMLGPHAADQAVAAAPERKLHQLTLDGSLQQKLEALARDRARALGPEISIAILVVDHASGEILAHVGSADYFDARRAGQIDMTQALRSPGSALKPFIYGLAFEDGLLHPETLIDDRPLRYGSYAPENFDLTFQGTVSVRRALQLSLNVPAVAVLDALGPSRLAARLQQAGAALVLPTGEAPGLAMGLGGVGIRLADLTMLYAGLPRLGTVPPAFEDRNRGPATARRLLDPAAAWYVGNILLGTPPPENAGGGRIAFKTGTSYGYRDAWALGFDGRRTIGVWVGRPDGAPVPGLVGRAAAAPILFDVFSRTDRPIVGLPAAPTGAIVAAGTRLPHPLRRFRPGGFFAQNASGRPRILFPPNGARLEAGRERPDPVVLKVSGGAAPLLFLVNGVPVESAARNLVWQPEGPGFARLTVIDAGGAADSVVVRVE